MGVGRGSLGRRQCAAGLVRAADWLTGRTGASLRIQMGAEIVRTDEGWNDGRARTRWPVWLAPHAAQQTKDLMILGQRG